MLQPGKYTARQQMISTSYELQYKRDTYLKSVELHHHDFYEIFFLISGDITYTIESKLFRVMPGEILIISPMELHQVMIKPEMEPYERYVLWIQPQTLKKLSEFHSDLCRILNSSAYRHKNLLHPEPEQQKQIAYLMESLYRESKKEEPGADLMRSSLLSCLLVTVERLLAHEACGPDESVCSNPRIGQIIDYISNHYDEPISLNQLSQQFFISQSHLRHEFQRLVGSSVYRYIQKKRLLIARSLLSSGAKPSLVYTKCGFGDYTAFYRAFKAEYGISPREYSHLCNEEG